MAGRVVRWVDDEPLPGWVEVQVVDVHGVVWSLFDKPPVFGGGDLVRPDSAFPVDVRVDCEVVGRSGDVVRISTLRPWGTGTADGRVEFDVRAGQVRSG